MKISSLMKLIMLLLITALFIGCIMVPVEDGYRGDGGENHGRNRGGHSGENHERH